jgi:hypothetical protein
VKVCKYCHEERPDDAFEVCRIVKGKVYRRLKCKKCKLSDNHQRRVKLRAWLIAYKKMLMCERCGFADFRALQFHHHGNDEKAFNVADMVRSVSSIESVKREIDKCIVLCSNCHQIEHYNERFLTRF